MTDLDLLHFEQLKSEIQAQYLQNHTPSDENISNWKGIDIIYFQEDLRKIAKGNISEKSFYTYFKTTPVTKLPRIDILNLLSVYAGYVSWFDFKKNHLFADEILEIEDNDNSEEIAESPISTNLLQTSESPASDDDNAALKDNKNRVLQNNTTESQIINQNTTLENTRGKTVENAPKKGLKDYLWLGISAVLALLLIALGLKTYIFPKEFTYTFIDADRNSKINDELDVQILKEDESPILFKVKPNESFIYKNPQTKMMTIVVSSPYYKTDTIRRNLETAPESENIELKPNDYAIMLYYYSNSIQDIKRKRERLNFLISDQALIYQIYDNDKYGVETLDKQRYINLVTTPTTSLKNMQVIETQMDKGKIILIKFRIRTNEDHENT